MLGENEIRQYLNVSIGKLRQRVKEGDSKAKARTIEDTGEVIYERIFSYIEAKLEKIFMRTHKEYGNSWVLHMRDGDSKYSVQFSENSRYGDDLLKKIPFLHYGKVYKITPFDFEPEGAKRKTGLSIKEGENIINSFYHSFTKLSDGKYNVTLLHGHPIYEGPKNDKEEVKIYYMRVRKFLRDRATEYLGNITSEDNGPATPEEATPMTGAADGSDAGVQDDLPF
jgi:hypothetical protein